MSDDLTRPIIGIENRTPLEVFDIMADRIRRARLSQAGAGGVVVKPLVWVEQGLNHSPTWRAESSFGRYLVYMRSDNSWAFEPPGLFGGKIGFKSPNEAMAAAQADYEARIRSALAARSSAGEPVGKRYGSDFPGEPKTVGELFKDELSTPPAPVQTASVEAVADVCQAVLKKRGMNSRPHALELARAVLASLTAPTQGERHLRNLRALAVALHARHYADVLQWQPLDDAEGLLSQIDNMTAGLSREVNVKVWSALQFYADGETDGGNRAHDALYATHSSPVSAPSPASGVREAIEAALDFLGGVDGASDVRAQLIAALSSPATPEPVSAPAGEVVVRPAVTATQTAFLANVRYDIASGVQWFTVGSVKEIIRALDQFADALDGRAALNPAPGHGEGGL